MFKIDQGYQARGGSGPHQWSCSSFLARWRFFNEFAKTIIITILLCSPLYLKVSLLFFQVGPIWIEADQVPALLEAIAVHPNIRYLCLSLCLCLCLCALARSDCTWFIQLDAECQFYRNIASNCFLQGSEF